MVSYHPLGCLLLTAFLHFTFFPTSYAQLETTTELEVTIPQGTVLGTTMTTRHGRNISAFLGIPYGQPPTGNLRFASPVAANGWNGTLNATVDPSKCPQIVSGVVVGDEDCLFVKVYTPQLPQNGTSSLLPVMVYIYGGGFAAESPDHNGPGYLLDADVVLVVLNYRLGALGFLSTGDEVASGNWGLKDQVLALKWVQDNIQYFSGDPDQVTIFGESAGAASVYHLASSNATIGLFHKCITQSGTSLAAWGHRPRAAYSSRAFELGEFVGCSNDTSDALITCLRTIDFLEITATQSEYIVWESLTLGVWGPTDEPDVEGAILTDIPSNLLAAGAVRDLPWITGVTRDEGLLHTAALYADEDMLNDFLENIDTLLPLMLNWMYETDLWTSRLSAIKSYYFNDDLTLNSSVLLGNLTLLIDDSKFYYPIYEALRKQHDRAVNPLYLYTLNYRGTYSYTYMDVGSAASYGVRHADDLIYLFPKEEVFSEYNKTMTETDYEMVDTMVQLWTSFAINGTPTASALVNGGITWEPYSLEDNYLRIGNESDVALEVQYSFFKERMEFWANIDALVDTEENSESTTNPEVTILQGTVLGTTMMTRQGRSISAFLGIPYGQPPTGNLRFTSPVAANGWNGTLNATVDPSKCPQIVSGVVVGEEDCLFVKVYTPQLPQNETSSLLPVMVYIYGGGFIDERPDRNGPGYLLDADVVLVVLNYRLGPLGFLSTGDEVASGNWGLKDQILALEWVQDNIQYFGGDPDQVTIFGESAGAVSVYHLASTNKTIGLFHRCITQSGSSLAAWGHRPRIAYSSRAFELGEFVGCSNDTSDALISCLRTIDFLAITATQLEYIVWESLTLGVWGPTDEPDVEGAILTDIPSNLLAAGAVRDLPWITGVTRDEGLLHTAALYADEDIRNDFLENIDFLLPTMLRWTYQSDFWASRLSAAKSYYFNDDLTSNNSMLLENLTLLIDDSKFWYPVYNALQQQLVRAVNPMYFYTFNYRGTYSYTYTDVGAAVSYGVRHADDLIYLFPKEETFSEYNKTMTETDYEMVDTMVQLWTSFAINGTPTASALVNGGITWEPYSLEDNYFRIGNESDVALEVQYSFFKERMEFWANIDALVDTEEDSESTTEPQVEIPQGTVLGTTMTTRYGRNISAFLGIPFAQPPIGNLRFANPVAAGGWNGTLDASTDSNMCPQIESNVIVGDEDCLYLNVYTPHLPPRNATNSSLLPVMVYIHGGGFEATRQSSTGRGGPDYLLDANVVLVGISYRLGPLGFLSTGDEIAPGNWGLKDQVMGLKWLQNNVRYFGGDPDQVTIFGESAGAASVHSLTLSDATIGLFHRYITQSGSALGEWAHRPRAAYSRRAFELGEYVGCSNITSDSLISCLRTVSSSDIIASKSQFVVWRSLPDMVWGPTDEPDVEGAILTDSPANLFAAGKIRDLPWISGVVRDEGLLHTTAFYEDDETFADFMENIDTLLPILLCWTYKSDSGSAWTQAAKSYYFNNDLTSNTSVLLKNLTMLIGDAQFYYPVRNAVQQQHAIAENPQYFYTLNYRGTYSTTWLSGSGTTANYGVTHADDLIYLFPREERFSTLNETMGEIDYQVVDTMVELWTSFAINGIPTTSALASGITWEPYSTQDAYLRIGNDSDPSLEVQYSFFKERMEFWASIDDFEETDDNSEDTTGLEVTIPQGTVLGTTMTTRHGRNIFAFLGIPYGQPPTGNLRFASPVAANGWNGTLNATVDPSKCPQFISGVVVGEEDCLFVKVYTPQLTNSSLLPVMVYIHGGGFASEDPDYNTPEYLLDADVVLVVLNYRLGSLGFLSTGDEVASGNWGLKDQVLALKWVQDNVHYFGGDPDQVTIFGESAGSVSVHLLTLSNATIGLFHRYITQSGSALADWAHRPRAAYSSRAFQLGEILGCYNDTSALLISCLRTADFSNITASQSLSLSVIVWGPTDELDVEGAILTDSPMNLFAAGKIRDLPWISGIVRDEGLLFTLALYEDEEILYNFLENLNTTLPAMLSWDYQPDLWEARVNAVRSYYFDNDLTSTASDLLKKLTMLVGDSQFYYPAHNALQKQHALAVNSQYFYTFNYRGTFSYTYIDVGSTVNYGVRHVDELIYLFPKESVFSALNETMSETDYEMVDTMVQLWTSFAINGTPTASAMVNNGITWEPYSSEDNYLRIGNESDAALEVQYSFFEERMQFWANIDEFEETDGDSGTVTLQASNLLFLFLVACLKLVR